MRGFIFLIVLASLWQAGGALLYMTALGHSSAAPWVYGAVKIVMLALPFLAIAIGWKPGAFLKGTRWRDVVIGLALGAIFFAVIFATFQFFPELFAKAFEGALPRAQAFGIAAPSIFILVGLLFAVFHSLFEEFYWRWFVFGTLRSLSLRRIALPLSGFAFALHHIVILLAFTTPLFAILFGFLIGAIGSLWSFLYDRRGNIAAIWISHLLADLAIASVAFVILFGA